MSMHGSFARSRFRLIEGVLVAEASDLRFPVGRWPNTIVLDDGACAFRRAIERDKDGDVTVVRYAGDVRIDVFND